MTYMYLPTLWLLHLETDALISSPERILALGKNLQALYGKNHLSAHPLQGAVEMKR